MYMQGEEGVPADPERAVKLWEDAAQAGHTEAQYKIGAMAVKDYKVDEARPVQGGKEYGVSSGAEPLCVCVCVCVCMSFCA
jgi:TPR repeat protein